MSDTPNPPGILITRPAQQAGPTIDAVSHQGWQAIQFPTIIISPVKNLVASDVLQAINVADWIIFISQNAVLSFLELFNADSIRNKKLAVVGQATARLLHNHGLDITAQPEEDFSSEGLLALEEFSKISGQQVVIVRGMGGREALADTLRERGASVTYVETYERCLADSDPRQLLPLWPDQINVIIATSNQLLDNLVTLCKNTLGNELFQKPLVVISERMRSHAHNIGFEKIWLAERSSNDEIIKTISRNMASAQNRL